MQQINLIKIFYVKLIVLNQEMNFEPKAHQRTAEKQERLQIGAVPGK
jgi:hypothetical protein